MELELEDELKVGRVRVEVVVVDSVLENVRVVDEDDCVGPRSGSTKIFLIDSYFLSRLISPFLHFPWQKLH